MVLLHHLLCSSFLYLCWIAACFNNPKCSSCYHIGSIFQYNAGTILRIYFTCTRKSGSLVSITDVTIYLIFSISHLGKYVQRSASLATMFSHKVYCDANVSIGGGGKLYKTYEHITLFLTCMIFYCCRKIIPSSHLVRAV